MNKQRSLSHFKISKMFATDLSGAKVLVGTVMRSSIHSAVISSVNPKRTIAAFSENTNNFLVD